MNLPGCQPCPPTCEQLVFDRVVVSLLIRGGTRVLWELVETFLDPPPLLFTLQASLTANQDADDWVDVGLPVENVYFAIDDEQRVFGKTNFTHYRVKLVTQFGTYYSLPTGAMGTLDRRSWRLAREIIRQRLVAYRYGPGAQRGYLLKRRTTGTPCPVCLDTQTKEVRDPECPSCFGTGFLCGYFFPQSCVWAEMEPQSRRTHLDGQQRGTIEDTVIKAEMLLVELLAEDDVWVNAGTDDRFYVHQVQDIAEYRGVPLVAKVELRPIPYTRVIYGIEIPQQLQELGLS